MARAPPPPSAEDYEAASSLFAEGLILKPEFGELIIAYGTTVKEALQNPSRITRADQGAMLQPLTTANLAAAAAAYELPVIPHGVGQKAAIIESLLDLQALTEWREVLRTIAYPRPALPAPPPAAGGGGFQAADLKALGDAIGGAVAAQQKRERDQKDLQVALGVGGSGGGHGGAVPRVGEKDFERAFADALTLSGAALPQYFVGKPLPPGYEVVKVEDVTPANPAAPAPGRGSKAVLTNVTPHAKLVLARVLGAWRHYDLGVRWKDNNFVFYPPPKCTLGVATAAVCNAALDDLYSEEMSRPIAPLSPTARELLRVQLSAVQDTVTTATAALVKTEGSTVDTGPLLLYIFGYALAASRIILCPRDMDYDLGSFYPFRAWLQGETVLLMAAEQRKLLARMDATKAAADAAVAAARTNRGKPSGGGGGCGGAGGGPAGGNGASAAQGAKQKDNANNVNTDGDWLRDWLPWCNRPANRSTKCTKDHCPIHGPKRAGPRGKAAGHPRDECAVLLKGKSGDPRECITGNGVIKDYYNKHPTEKVPALDQSFLDANRE